MHLLVEPGEYALSYSEPIARSAGKDTPSWPDESRSIQDGKSLLGRFKIGADEFGLPSDILDELRRSATHDLALRRRRPESFQKYLATYVKPEYPFLDTEAVRYRPFVIGINAIERGNGALETGNHAEALSIFTQALDQAEDEGNEEHRAIAMYGLARTNARLCRVTAAEKWFRDSIVLREAMPDNGGVPVTQNYREFARFLLSRAARRTPSSTQPGRCQAGKTGLEKIDPIGYADFLDDYVGAMKCARMDQDLEVYAAKSAKLRSKYPGRKADFRTEPYPVNCEETGT